MLPTFVWRWCAALLLVGGLSACGGGGGGGSGAGESASATATTGSPETPATATTPAPLVEKPATRAEAARFLTQATFGPTEADITRVMTLGYGPWIDEQLALPAASHRAWFEARDAEIKAASPGSSAWQDQVLESFWKQALTGPDQLRQRVAYALSQIFVVSMADGTVGDNPRAVAAWLDLLGTQGLGNYRQLLESVSRHPLMGQYLSHLRNQRADARTGRVPDENYAREVMQLFSIGLVDLNEDGSAKTVGSQLVESYTPADISGLAQVFTGWSWACPNWPDNSCFFWGSADGASDADRSFKAMLGYPQYHSKEEKRFLGTTIALQELPDPAASLRVALDTLAAHPNVGPFIGRQLIQRLVSSNPSPAYVRDVARVWANNGAGVRGDLKAVIKAVLMHAEARSTSPSTSDTSGKLREPVLRLSAYLRAFPHRSDSGHFKVGNTDNPGSALAQTPLRAPSVFNFYRPGYVPPGTAAAARKLAVPELQIANETTAAGYVNFMRDNVASGVGQWNGVLNGVTLNRRDLQPNWTAELALAGDPAALTAHVVGKLVVGQATTELQTEIADAVGRVAVPVLNSNGSNQTQIDNARRNRVNAALLLTLAAPEFAVQP